MNPRQVERELTALLHRRAEDAMKNTNTLAEHRRFQSVVADQEQTDRRRWVAGGVAAAVAAAVVGAGVWSSDPGGGSNKPPIAQAPVSTKASNLAAAEGFAAAFAAHDAAAAESLLAASTEEPWAGSARAWERDAAFGVEYLMKPCTKQYTSFSDSTLFTCPYAMHLLGSREVGKGPFRHNTLQVNVSGGKVRYADNVMPFETNGMTQHYEAVHAWVAKNHPEDKRFLFMDEQDVRPADWPRWSQLWKQYIREYVAATNGPRRATGWLAGLGGCR
jgi:hypothetical protein